MADGASSHSVRRSMHGSHGGGAPVAAAPADFGNWHTEKHRDRPRVAYTGEEFGFGFKAAETFAQRVARRRVYDGGLLAVLGKASPIPIGTEREFQQAAFGFYGGVSYDFDAPAWQPLRTKEQTLLAVKQHTADFAVVPFYHPYFGYDFETLRALGSLLFLLGVEQVEATDNMCLAVHESQLYDLIQSAHPGTGFSSLQRRFRKSWGAVDQGSGNTPSASYDEMPRAGLPIDMADQKLIRDRIDLVFTGPEAARRCKQKLDGLRSIGVEVSELPQMVEPHRELARRARSATNTARQTNTFFDPISGETRFFSTLGAETQAGKLYAMVLPYEVAMRSSDYVIIDHNFDDGQVQKERFLTVAANPDHTLTEDAYRTTDAKTRYWYTRLSDVALARTSGATTAMRAFGTVGIIGGLCLLLMGAATVLGGAASLPDAIANLRFDQSVALLAAGAAISIVAWFFANAQAGGDQGVRVMFRFLRNKAAASTADIENFLRNHGVRYAVVRTDEDSEGHEPAPIILDVEFEPRDFEFDPLSVFSRRAQNSVVNGALKKAFARWKSRGVTIIAAMPIQNNAYQMPKPKMRRWWAEAFSAWAADFGETMFIRLSRILIYLLPIAIVVLLVWQALGGGD